MRTVIFGDPFLFRRTQRAFGGEWLDISTPQKLPIKDTLFIQAGALIQKFSGWKNKEVLVAVGATPEEERWKNYFNSPRLSNRPDPRSFFLSARAIKELNKLWNGRTIFEAISKIKGQTWVEPQLRNWYHEKLRVLQVVTSLQVGGAERVCLDLSAMPECVGIASWGAPRRSVLANANWDLTNVPYRKKTEVVLKLARRLNVDLIHTHLLDAEINVELEKHFPVVTTMHNTPEGWPRGYDKLRPGLLVGCSREVTRHLGPTARTAWNGIGITTSKSKTEKKDKEIKLISVANFRPQKQLHKLPRILAELRKRRFKPTLTIVGQIHQTDPRSLGAWKKFWSEAKKFRVDKIIQEVHSLDVSQYLAESTVFVSVSAHEGLSLSQLEALGSGLPVVATDVGGAPDIKREVKGDGYITLPKNANARKFADEIVRASELERRDRLPTCFNLQSMRKRYLWIYYASLSRGPTSNEIWLVTNNFSMGGAQTSAKRLLAKLTKQYDSVRAFTLQESKPTKGSIELAKSGVIVSNLEGANAYLRALNLMRLCAISRPKGVLFWNTMSNEKCLIADGITAPITDVSPGEMYFKEMERYLSKPIIELPIRGSRDYGRLVKNGVVKYGREVERMQTFLGKTPYVVPNGVTGIKLTRRNFKKKLVFGTAARIAPHKRLEDIINAFEGIDADLLIAGRIEPGADDYYKMLRSISGPNIKWMEEQKINEFLPKLDLFVMVSEPAGCPNASLEAMANGLPIIATDFGGANEQIINGLNGWLVAPRDINAMKRAIKEALSLPPSTLKVMSKAAVFHSKNFSIEKMVDNYLAILNS